MSYKDEYHPKIKNDLKGLDKAVAKEIFATLIDKILKEPHVFDKLQWPMDGVFSYHFKKNKVEYRIAYTIDDEKRVVLFLMIRKRENFYDLLKRRLS